MILTPFYLSVAIAGVLAYFMGGLPFGYWFVLLTSGADIRLMGSGNIGATNVHRTAGRKAGMIVLLLDMLKGFVAVWIAALLTHGSPLGLAVAAVAVMLGHCYPVLLKFKGGKAVACFVGAFLYISPLVLFITLLIFVFIVSLTRYISLASVISALLFPFLQWFLMRPPTPILVASILAAALVVYRHKANISRLRSGKEHVFSLKGGPV